MSVRILRCAVCGVGVEADTEFSVAKCGYCGSAIAVPCRCEQKGERYDMAHYLRQSGDFPAAEGVYDKLLREGGEDAEAYFGRALSRYGVRYQRNPISLKWEPDCSQWRQRPILQEPDYLCAMELADALTRAVYRQMGEQIDQRWQINPVADGGKILLFYRPDQSGLESFERRLWEKKNDGRESKENILMADGNSSWVLGSKIKRQDIRRICFFASLAEKPADSWDVSAKKDESVMAWVKPDEEKYELYVAAEGKIRANRNCYGLFRGYTCLEEICFNHCFQTFGVANMAFMFGDCKALRRVDVGEFDTSQVTDMSGMFTGCKNLSELDVSDFETIRVTNMSCMFDGCSGLVKLDVRNLETFQVVNMSCMFNGCSSLTKLDIRDFDTFQVTDMSCMFNGCSNLLKLDVRNFDTSQVRDMSYMFYGCTSLLKLDVSGFCTSRVEDMRGMFYNCISLFCLDIQGFDKSNVKEDTLMLAGTRWG